MWLKADPGDRDLDTLRHRRDLQRKVLPDLLRGPERQLKRLCLETRQRGRHTVLSRLKTADRYVPDSLDTAMVATPVPEFVAVISTPEWDFP